jgi:hypothetical protein
MLKDSIILDLDENIKNDINEYNKSIRKYEGAASQISQYLNNSYLISQGQKEGIKSYGKMTDLLIAKYIRQ